MAGTELAQVLDDIRARIKQNGGRGLNEQNTKATLIEPVLRALRWNPEDVEEVVREYTSEKKGNPVDYGLLTGRQPRLFVEAKPLHAPLGDSKWATQIMSYAVVAGVTWMVLTNGDEYRIYNAHAKVPIEEKLWRAVRISDATPLVEETLELLARDRLDENRIDALWQAHFVDRKVRGALEDLLGGSGREQMISLVRKRVPDLSPSEIRASLRRCRPTLDFPVPPSGGAKAGGKKGTKVKKPPVSSGVSLSDLLSAKLLAPPVTLTRRYKGRTLSATIESDGRVTCLGRHYTSLSLAGAAARASVVGVGQDGKPPATNGWAFWTLIGPGGKPVPVASVREQFRVDGP